MIERHDTADYVSFVRGHVLIPHWPLAGWLWRAVRIIALGILATPFALQSAGVDAAGVNGTVSARNVAVSQHLTVTTGLPAVSVVTPLSDAVLDTYRGGQAIVVGDQRLIAVTSGNVLNGNYVAGSIALSGNAFSNFNGIGNFAINTGAQVSLQSGLNLVVNVGQ